MLRKTISIVTSGDSRPWLCLSWALFTFSLAQAGELSLSPTPLLQTSKVPPNIILALNDSYHAQGQGFVYGCTLGACNEPGKLSNFTNINLFNVDDRAGDLSLDVYLDVVPTAQADGDRSVWLAPSEESQPDWWGYWLGRYYEWDKTYYNPNITYKPWLGFGDADPEAARLHPDDESDLTTIDLTQPITYYSKNHRHPCTREDKSDCVKVEDYYIPRYYEITKDWVRYAAECVNTRYPACDDHEDQRKSDFWAGCVASGNCPYGGNHQAFTNRAHGQRGPDLLDEYRRIEIKPGADYIQGTAKMPAKREDCTKLQDYQYSCTYAQEIQNFANWYVYYRDRFKLIKSGMAAAIDALPKGVRVAYFSYYDNPYYYLVGNNSSSRIYDAHPAVTFDTDDDRKIIRDAILKAHYRSGTNHTHEGDMGAVAMAALYLRGDYAAAKAEWASPILPANAGGSCQQNYLILGAGLPGFSGRPREGGMQLNSGAFAGPASWKTIWDDGMKSALWKYSDYSSAQGEPPYMNFPRPGHDWTDQTSDAAWNSLANATLWAYATDLRPDLPDLVQTVPGTAFKAAHQHLETFTIGIGEPAGLDPLRDKTPTSEEDSDPMNPNFGWLRDYWFGVDTGQLWHAAVAGRGRFLTGDDMTGIQDAFKDIIMDIKARLATLGTPSLNQIAEGDLIYVPSFRSPEWVGEVEALRIPSNADGSPGLLQDAVVVWKASAKLDAQDWDSGRTVLTFNGDSGKGVAFRWPADPTQPTAEELDKAMVDALIGAGDAALGEARTEYLRGKRDYEDEASNPHFRPRDTVLGDVIDSGPSYVAAPAFHYPDALEPTDHYSGFKGGTAKDRTPMLYLGANDGMLHGLDAENGTERLAYVPLKVAPRLAPLTDTAYAHQYSVDGPPVVVDAHGSFPRCGGGNCWGTILAGGLRGGGQGVYALDVTDPNLFQESKADKVVLWEFTDAEDEDLGYTYSRPNIVRLHNGEWAVVFGNGYNNTEDDTASGGSKSATGNAVLYVVAIDDGHLIKKIDTGYGTTQDPTGLNRPNGLATVASVDLDGDYVTDVVYAGDLFGNLWKFDLRDENPAKWDSGYLKSGNPTPLFTACHGTVCDGTNVQPIMIQPQVGPHPTGQGALVYFGTGKYLEQIDVDEQNQVTQTFYAIWDKDDQATAGFGRNALLKQEITEEVTQTFGAATETIRVTSDNPITWHLGAGIPAGNPAVDHLGWYLDLKPKDSADNHGERVVTEPVLHSGRIVFVSMRPGGGDPCQSVASSWVMDLDAKDGSRWTRPVLDLNADGAFDLNDMADTDGDQTGDTVISGLKLSVGIPTTPVFRGRGGKEKMTIFGSGSSGGSASSSGQDLDRAPPPHGRQSWRELRP